MAESVFAERIVQNLLDTDFYKLTMMQAVLHNYPNAEVEWEFRCRNAEDLRPYLAEKAIAHYRRLGIDPLSKTLVFSDGLDMPKALQLFRALRGKINVSFGIGTNLTCDIPGVEPMNIVLKMTACNGHPVAKISDAPGKTQCRDENFVAYLRHVFNVPA